MHNYLFKVFFYEFIIGANGLFKYIEYYLSTTRRLAKIDAPFQILTKVPPPLPHSSFCPNLGVLSLSK